MDQKDEISNRYAIRLRSITLTPRLGNVSNRSIIIDPNNEITNHFLISDLHDDFLCIPISNQLNDIFNLLSLNQEIRSQLISINFLIYPDPKELILDFEGKLNQASFSQILLMITSPGFSNPSLLKTILLTLLSFIHPILFFLSLVTRYYSLIGLENSNVQDSIQLNLIRQRVVSIITLWTKLCNYHFTNLLLEALILLRDHLLKADHSESKETQSKMIKAAVLHLKKNLLINKSDLIFYTPDTQIGAITLINSFLKYDPEKLSNQFTLRHSNLFRNINQQDWLEAIFTGEKKGSLNELIKNFDFITRFVSFSVVYGENEKERSNIYQMWVKLLIEFRKQNDFFGLFSVLSGLNHKSVSRLNKTLKIAWNSLKKFQNIFNNIQQICEFENDFKNYREIISNSPIPFVPFIACFQKDWVYFQETFKNPPSGLISIKKLEIAVEHLDRVTRFQNDRYPFEENIEIQKLITNILNLQIPQHLMQISICREPTK